MIKVNIVAVGKVKEKYFSEGIAEYSKRLSKYCDFKIIEVGEENFNKVGDAEINAIKEREGKKILQSLRGEVIALAIEGKKLSSVDLAKEIKSAVDGGKELTFVIGGSYGLSDEVKNKANMLLSFSDMTFPHTMFRLMLTEQIYRAFSINQGTPYHK